MISKRLRESLDSSICIRDIFEEGKKLAAIYGAENIFNFTIGNPSVEPPAAVNEALKEIIDTEKPLALHGYPANVGHPEDGMATLQRLGFKTAAMALRNDTVNIDDPGLMSEEKLAIVLGTEGDGLCEDTIANCDYTIKIPMAHGVDSLNVAAASAVAFWQLGNR